MKQSREEYIKQQKERHASGECEGTCGYCTIELMYKKVVRCSKLGRYVQFHDRSCYWVAKSLSSLHKGSKTIIVPKWVAWRLGFDTYLIERMREVSDESL